MGESNNASLSISTTEFNDAAANSLATALQQTMMASNSFSNLMQLQYLQNLSVNATNLQSVLLSNASAVGMPPSASS
eukprot:2029889-Rhodomonas_salina.2